MYIYCHPQDFCVLLAQSLENFTSQGVMHASFLILYLSWSSCISELLGKSSDYIWKRTRWIYQYLQLRSNLKRNLNNMMFIVARENKDSKIPSVAVHRLTKLLSTDKPFNLGCFWQDEPQLEGQVLLWICQCLGILGQQQWTSQVPKWHALLSVELPFSQLKESQSFMFQSLYPQPFLLFL